MIERVVLFKLKDAYATPDARAEIAAHSRQALQGLAGVVSCSVGVPADAPSEKSWDLSLVLHFESLSAVDAFRQDPAYREYVDEYMRPRVEVEKAWNFNVSDG